MSLVRWEPFSGVDELFNRMLPASFGRLPRFSVPSNGGEKYEWAPSANISETEKEFLIRAELPAVKKEDVKVTVDQGVITIEGERRQEETTRRRSTIASRASTVRSRVALRFRTTQARTTSAAKARMAC